MSVEQIADVVGGRLSGVDPSVVVDGPVTIDSRVVEAGGLFAAIVGERADGHDHAATASAAGSVAALVSRDVDVPCIVVDDVVGALQALAAHVRRQLDDVTVIGVTGSSGKTTVKDLLCDLLTPTAPTVATEASFNNEIGLPLTVLRADADTRFLVLEMGSRGVGHIADLCRIAGPDIGVVLNVGSAHIGEFGSADVVATAKGELVAALPSTGVAVLNADDERVAAMVSATNARTTTFGVDSPTATVRAEHVRLVAGAPQFTLAVDDQRVGVALNLLGEHQVLNALAAATVAVQLGIDGEDVATRLSQATPRSRWRMELSTHDGITVLNDAYNANPESMRAALKTLVQVAGERRSWAVLGEMRELGPDAAEQHDAIGRLAVRLDVSRLVAVGAGARAIHLGASHEGSWGEESAYVEDVSDAIDLLRENLRPGDVVLVKASRAAGLERIAEAVA